MKAKWQVGIVAAVLVAPIGALAAGQVRTIEIAVTQNGFEPARVQVTQGEPLKLIVTRKTDQTCATEILIHDANVMAELPLNAPVTLTFTPKYAGELKYACSMNMIKGFVVVASNDAAGNPGVCSVQGTGERQGSGGAQRMQGAGATKDHQAAAVQGKRCGCMHRGTASHAS